MKDLKSISEINQSDKARRKLKQISNNCNLPLDFITTLYNFNWDLDSISKSESYGWVTSKQYTEKEFQKAKEKICNYLQIDIDFKLKKEEVIENLIFTYSKIDKLYIENKFLIGGETNNKTYVSEYATFHYLNNLTKDNLFNLDSKEILDTTEIFNHLFFKVFRCGSIERYNLFYVFTDMFFKLPYDKNIKRPKNEWIKPLIEIIQKNKSYRLNDLIKCCKPFVKGDKYFKQTILEALSYSGKLKVNNIKVENIFIPNHRNELANHFYSNEWSYPLRMWNENNDTQQVPPTNATNKRNKVKE